MNGEVAPIEHFGKPFKSLLRIEFWFGQTPGRLTLWRAVDGAWVEVATSTSTRILCNKFASGFHVVMRPGQDPNGTVEVPLELAPRDGVLFS